MIVTGYPNSPSLPEDDWETSKGNKSSFPSEPGFYWWRENKTRMWNLVILENATLTSGKPCLLAIDPMIDRDIAYPPDCFPKGPKESSGICGMLNFQRWSNEGRPVGEWLKIEEPPN